MPHVNRFEDLIIWKESIQLAKLVFHVFRHCRNYSMRNQIERSSISVSANIAEGHELMTNKQLIKHLYIAKASCEEVRSLLILSKEMNLYPLDQLDPLITFSNKLSVMIYNFIKSQKGD